MVRAGRPPISPSPMVVQLWHTVDGDEHPSVQADYVVFGPRYWFRHRRPLQTRFGIDPWGVPIRVGIIDNEPALVLGITVLVNAQPDMTFVSSGRTVRELLSEGKTLDVVLVDPAIGEPTSQPHPVEALLTRGIGVLIFSSGSHTPFPAHVSGTAGVEAMRKTDPLHRLIAGIRAVQRSGPEPWGFGPGPRNPTSAPAISLSPREREVLELYATGSTAAQVGAALGITRNTVVDHIKHIRVKYLTAGRPASSKVELFRRAVEDGLVGDGTF